METSQPASIQEFIDAAEAVKDAFNRHRLPDNLEDAHKMIMDLERRLGETSSAHSAASALNRKLTIQRDAARRLAAKHRRRARKVMAIINGATS